MKELAVFNFHNVDVVDSREVAEMIGKSHAHLMRDISGYAQILAKSDESKFGLVDFFIPHTYQDAKGETRPCYLLTKKGCDMVANKMTGEKGVLFTAAYVTAFEKMKERLSGPVLPKDYPSALRALADAEEKRMALEAENERQRQAIADFEPIRQYVDSILESSGIMATSQIAADYGLSARKLNAILNEAGIQRNVNGQWILYKKYMGKGYTKSKTIHFARSDGREDTKMQTYWTQKGRLLIHETLTQRGIVAVMDQKNTNLPAV